MKEPSALRPVFDWTPHRLSTSPELDASLLAGHLPDVNLLLRSGWLAAREPSRGGVARELLAFAAAMFPLDFARVTALSEDGRRRALAEWSGAEGRDAAPAEGFLQAVLRAARPLYVPAVSQEARVAAGFGAETASALGVPLLQGLRVVAVAEFHRFGGAAFALDEARLLWMLCLQAQGRFQTASAAEALRSQALTDALTGLGNRRQLDRELRSLAATHLRAARPLAALMIDLDDFKAYNDRFGHRWGDRALRDLGRLIRGALRVGDVACRYGGEEFVALLPDTDREGGRQLAERLRDAVARHRFPPSGDPLAISIGVAAMPGDAADGKALLQAADEALYRAKAAGKNRVALAPSGLAEAAAGAWGEADRGPARTGADHVAHLLVRAAMEATGARRGSLVWRLGERWMLHTAVGFEAKRMPQGMAVEAGLGVLGALFKEGRPMVVEDIRGLPEVSEDRSRGYTTRAFLAIPLYWTGKPAGALFLTNREGGRAFATEDLALILPLVKTLMDCLGGKVAEAESRVLH